MNIKKEIIKSLLKENFQKLCKSPLFKKRVEEEKSRHILSIANHLDTIINGEGIPGLGPEEKTRHILGLANYISAMVDKYEISNLKPVVAGVKNTEEEKIKNFEKLWKDKNNAKDKDDLFFTLLKIDYLEKELKKYDIRTKYDIDKEEASFSAIETKKSKKTY